MGYGLWAMGYGLFLDKKIYVCKCLKKKFCLWAEKKILLALCALKIIVFVEKK